MEKKRYVRKKQSLYKLVSRLKLWPSRKGILHGVREVEDLGEILIIRTHCGHEFTVNNSRNARSVRWLRNNYTKKVCEECKIPQWKIEKYSKTVFH